MKKEEIKNFNENSLLSNNDIKNYIEYFIFDISLNKNRKIRSLPTYDQFCIFISISTLGFTLTATITTTIIEFFEKMSSKLTPALTLLFISMVLFFITSAGEIAGEYYPTGYLITGIAYGVSLFFAGWSLSKAYQIYKNPTSFQNPINIQIEKCLSGVDILLSILGMGTSFINMLRNLLEYVENRS